MYYICIIRSFKSSDTFLAQIAKVFLPTTSDVFGVILIENTFELLFTTYGVYLYRLYCRACVAIIPVFLYVRDDALMHHFKDCTVAT